MIFVESLDRRVLFVTKSGAGTLVLYERGDLNHDRQVDLADFEHFRRTAPFVPSDDFIRNSAGPGDADCNGKIDKFDVRALSARFNESGDWHNGDYSMNDIVTIQDFALAAANVLTK